MRKTLTASDIKELRYQCRMGYVIPFFFFVFGSLLVSVIVDYLLYQDNDSLNNNHIFLVVGGMFILSVFMNFKMNGKYISDIRNTEKILEIKTIQQKESKIDAEAGSGKMSHGMKVFKRHNLIIENTRYRIDKELFENCAKGDEVYFHIAPKSKFRFNIELKGNASPKYSNI